MADMDLQIKITALSEEAVKAFEGINKSIEELKSGVTGASKELDKFEKAGKSLSSLSSTFDGLGRSLKNFGKDVSLYVSAPIAALGVLAIKSFSNSEQEVGKLNQSLANSGRYSEEASQGMQAFAKELEKVSIFSTGTVVSSLALATNFAKTDEKAKELVKTAADLATFLGTDLESAVRTLGVTLNGNAGRLGQQFAQIENLTDAQLRNGDAIKVVAALMQGQANNAAQTLTGQITILKNEFNTFLESIGKDLAPAVETLVKYLRSIVREFNDLDAGTRKTVISFGLFLAAAGPLLIGLGSLAGAFANISKAAALLIAYLPQITSFFSSLLAFLSGPASIAAAIALTAGSVAGLVNIFLKLRTAGLSIADALRQSLGLIPDLFESYLVAPLTKSLGFIYTSLSKIPGALTTPIGRDFQALGSQLEKSAQEMAGSFRASKAKIDTQLSKIGSSAWEAFTFGFGSSAKDTTAVAEAGKKSGVVFGAGFKEAAIDESLGVDIALSEIAEKQRSDIEALNEETDMSLSEIADKQKRDIDLLKQQEQERIQTNNAIAGQISSGAASGLIDFAEGAKSAKEAFADFARSTLKYIAQIIIQQAILNSIKGAAPGLFGGGANADGGLAGSGPYKVKKLAGGGSVTGPGSGRSDSIPAWLSNGEFVATAKAVKTFGTDFYHGLNRMASKGSGIPSFADGGLASGGSSGGSIQIINSGQPKEATSTSFDPKTAITTVILEDLNRNGDISKSFSSTYGVKRGGFR